MSTDERERAEFEAEMRRRGYTDFHRSIMPGTYADNALHNLWQGWQARAQRATPTPAQAPAQPVAHRLISSGPNAGRVKRYTSDEESKGEYALDALPPLAAAPPQAAAEWDRFDSMAPPQAAAQAPAAPLQGGMSNSELASEWARKLPGVRPTERDLTAFALGAEVGFERARDLERSDWNRIHHVLKDAGVHPGRTDDHLADVIARALAAAPAQAAQPTDEPPGIVHGGFELPAAATQGLRPSEAMNLVSAMAAQAARSAPVAHISEGALASLRNGKSVMCCLEPTPDSFSSQPLYAHPATQTPRPNEPDLGADGGAQGKE